MRTCECASKRDSTSEGTDWGGTLSAANSHPFLTLLPSVASFHRALRYGSVRDEVVAPRFSSKLGRLLAAVRPNRLNRGGGKGSGAHIPRHSRRLAAPLGIGLRRRKPDMESHPTVAVAPWNQRFQQVHGDSTFEVHYSIADLAKQWRLGRETVRLLVKDEPGVLRVKLGRKRATTRYSVPESVARRVHTKLFYSAA